MNERFNTYVINAMDSEQQTTPQFEVNEPELPTPESVAEAIAEEDSSPFLAEIEQLKVALKQSEAKNLRTLAELENLKKRTERDVSQAHKFGTENLLKSLIPIIDGFATGKQSMTQEMTDFSTIVEGIEMLEKQLVDVLEKHGVEIISPSVGDAFDVEQHQAMVMQPSDKVASNCILEVFQKGFRLHGRLLRAAMVVVSQ